MENVNENFGKYTFKTLNSVKGISPISLKKKNLREKKKTAGRRFPTIKGENR